MNSLKARLLLVASLVLAIFLSLTGFALDRALQRQAEQAEQDKLQGFVYGVLGAADVDEQGNLIIETAQLAEPRFRQPDSGLYTAILDSDGQETWRSPSLMRSVILNELPAVGEWRFARVLDQLGNVLFAMTFGVNWAGEDGQERRYTFLVVEETGGFNRQLHKFRGTLLAWLLASGIVLLIVQLLVLRWGLAPLARLAEEVGTIEAGDKEHIDGEYQDELRPLTEGLNAMLRNERAHQTRYRNALDDLAHSLKTPLAVLGGLGDSDTIPREPRGRLLEQLGRMKQIVDYQLKKAATTGRQALLKPQPLRPVVDKIVRSLGKVYKHKQIHFDCDIDEKINVRADEGDIMELLGNLLDNASKWCDCQVQLKAKLSEHRLEIEVEDDGPGFPSEKIDALLKRGIRADSCMEGQGIGLSVVAEIVDAYEGDIRLGQSSELAGARVWLSLPIG